MDELNVIREALDGASFYINRMEGVPATQADIKKAYGALDRLEAREARKTVPMAMLRECDRMNDPHQYYIGRLRDIAARYGYEVTE